jgi:hypothetical protein
MNNRVGIYFIQPLEIMNIQKGFFLLVACVAFFGVSSCSEEEQLENCAIGSWVRDSGSCNTSDGIVFRSDGTGELQTNQCPVVCTDGAEWGEKIYFEYEIGEGEITITTLGTSDCNEAMVPSNSPANITVAFDCNDDELKYGQKTYARQ